MKKVYFIRKPNGIITGPFTAEKLAVFAGRGDLTAKDQLSENMKEWWYYEGDGTRTEIIDRAVPLPAKPPVQETDIPSTPTEEELGVQRDDTVQEEISEKEPIPYWSLIISSVWKSYKNFPQVAEHIRPLAWFSIIYTLFASIIGWLVTSPMVFLSMETLNCFMKGLASWSIICLLQLIECWLCCHFAKQPFKHNREALALLWTGLMRNATLYGTLIMFHTILPIRRPITALPIIIIVWLCLWNEICHWKIISRCFSGHSSRAWTIITALHTLIFHTGLYIATII